MSKPATQIKNIIDSHLRGGLFGMKIWGIFEIPTHDSVTVVECWGPSRFERYGSATVYHPALGKWICSLDGSHLRGTPKQAMTTEDIRSALSETRSQMEALYRVYNVAMPEIKPVLWDAYWEA